VRKFPGKACVLAFVSCPSHCVSSPYTNWLFVAVHSHWESWPVRIMGALFGVSPISPHTYVTTGSPAGKSSYVAQTREFTSNIVRSWPLRQEILTSSTLPLWGTYDKAHKEHTTTLTIKHQDSQTAYLYRDAPTMGLTSRILLLWRSQNRTYKRILLLWCPDNRIQKQHTPIVRLRQQDSQATYFYCEAQIIGLTSSILLLRRS
jgi:hypothetical protein